nr:retrovirus-related Pol polyprotein from transposon TNT 1-94 [Tanacetum cinerariifolium]
KEVDELKAERLAKIQDHHALMANSNNPYASPAPHQDLSPFNQNYMQQPMPNPEDITDPTTAMNMALSLMAKTFKLNYSTPTNNNQRISSNPHNRQIAQPVRAEGNAAGHNGNQLRCYNCRGVGHFARDCTVRPRRRDAAYLQIQLLIAQKEEAGIQLQAEEYDLMAAAADLDEIEENQIGNGNLVAVRAEGNAAEHNGNQIRPRRRDAAYLQTQLLIAQKEEAGIQLQAEEYDLMAAAADLDEIEEVNANCILMSNLQQASSSGTQTDSAPVYDTDRSAENDNNVISEVTDVEQDGEIVEQLSANFEETRALYESLYQNLAVEVEKVNSVNRKLKETNADQTTELARVYFVKGLGHNLFSVGQFYDSDLEVAFRRNACFVGNLEGVDLLKGDRSTNLYTINLHEMASASPICLMARASSTKSWLWHQRLSHLNFDTINNLARNDLVTGLLKFKHHKEHICPSCEQGKSKRAYHPLKPVPNSRQRLHLLHMDLCGPMRIASINGKRIYNRRTKKIMETMNVSFDELLAMAFEQRSSKPDLQSELDLLFEAMYDDYFGGQPSATVENVLPAQEPQVRQTSTASTTIADNVPIPTNSSSHATNILITSQDVDELNPNAMVNGNTFVNPFATSSSNAVETSSS